MQRREFVKKSGTGLVLCLTGGAAALLESCSASTWLQEAANIITLIAPLGDGVLAIVSIADPAAAIPLAAIAKLYDAGAAALAKFLADEAASLKTAQPGAVNQLGAFVAALNADAGQIAAAVLQVKDPTTLAQAQTLTSSITSEIAALLTVIPKIVSPLPATARLSSGIVPAGYRSAKVVRGELLHKLRSKTGAPSLDARRAQIANQLAALNLN